MSWCRRLAVAFLSCALLLATASAGPAADDPLTLGVLAFRPKAETVARWQPLTRYLAGALNGRPIRLEALDYHEMEEALNGNRLDFVLANPSFFVHLRQRQNISGALATLVDLERGIPVEALGGVIITRSDRTAIATLGDLKGKSIAGIALDSLGGYQAQARELLRAGVRLPRDARLTLTDMPQDRAVLEVLAGRADAGFARTGIIEAMAREGRIDPRQLKVLNPQELPGFPFAISTHLYPQWPFFALSHVHEDVARRVSAALLSLEHGGEVARASAIHGFNVPAEYSEVESLMRELRLPPFDSLPAFTGRDVWKRYSGIIVALGAAATVIALLMVLLAIGNQRLRAAELRARQDEERYRTLVQNIDHGITLVDAQYRILMSNTAHRRLLKKQSAEVVGRKCFTAVHGRDTVCPDCPGQVALATGKPALVEKTFTRFDGTTRSVRVQAFPVLDPDGVARAFIELVEDTTEASLIEAEHKRLEARVLQAQKMESLGILAGGIAHDFNNLLMGILGNTDLALAKTAPESPLRPYLKAAEQAAQRAADLTNQMLAYSGKGRFVVEPINLSRIVEEIGHLLATVVSKGAAIRYRLAADLPPVEADATQIRQVVMNLITNASDALGDREGTVTVTTGTVDVDGSYLGATHFSDTLEIGRHVFLEVSDSGAGMDAATQARIFDPFFTTKHTGRGLGLAAVLGIVRGHHGAIKVYSEPGQGSTFKVLLPAMRAPGEAPAPPAAAIPGAAAAAKPGRGTVLFVDDEEMVRETSQAMLEAAGFQVQTANDGLEAVEIFRRLPGEFAAVILDMTMPRMGGEEAFREMRRIDERVPVILSSGFSEQEAVNRFTGKGLAGFIQKPYRLATLEEKLRAALERKECGAQGEA